MVHGEYAFLAKENGPMKKLLAFLLASLMLGATACAQTIQFRDIPWGSNVDAVSQRLPLPFRHDLEGTLPYRRSLNVYGGYAFDTTSQKTGWTVLAASYDPRTALTVAGYGVNKITAFCAYGRDEGDILYDRAKSRFYAAAYEFNAADIPGAYRDLQGKLNGLYGPCTETADHATVYTGGGVYDIPALCATWTDGQGASITLACEYDESDRGNIAANWLILTYGLDSFDAELDILDELVYQDAAQQERESQNSSTDGL